MPRWLVFDEVTLVPAMLYGRHRGVREFTQAADVLAAHPELAEVVVTDRYPLSQAAQAFEVAANRAAGAVKVHLTP